METFYKITKEEADAIGRFEYATNQAFDPYVSEQTDGTFLVSQSLYNLLKEEEEIKKVDFEKKQTISKNELDTKIKE